MINNIRELFRKEIIKRHVENKLLMKSNKTPGDWSGFNKDVSDAILYNKAVIRIIRQILIDDLASRPRENDYYFKKDGILNYIPSENIFRRARQS